MPSALLVHVPNVVWTDDDHYRTEIALMAMGLFAIADTADRRGISTEIINLYASWSADPEFDLAAYVEKTRPVVVGAGRHGDGAGLDAFGSREDAEDRGLAGPVGPDQPDLLAGVGLKAGVSVEHLPAKGFGHVRKVDHNSLRGVRRENGSQ